MIQHLLDTNICIYLLKHQPPALVARFARCRQGEVAVSAITWAELCCGLDVKNSQAQLDALAERLIVLPFGEAAARIFGILWQAHPQRGKNTADRLIAAHAIAQNATLVTNNPADFAAYQGNGLQLADWLAEAS
jgi:tRNA(fMet)-specific endonuclease VapC